MPNNETTGGGRRGFKKYRCARPGPSVALNQWKHRTWIVQKLIFETRLPFHPEFGSQQSQFLSFTCEYRQPHLWMSMVFQECFKMGHSFTEYNLHSLNARI